MTQEASQTLDRGLRLLELLAESQEPVSVTGLAGRLGVARPVVYRLLATFERHALAAADSTGRYRLGLGLLHLAERALPAVRATVEPELRRLAEEVRATAHLTLADSEEGVAVAVVEPSSTTYHVAYRAGSRHPLERGAAGRAIIGGRAARSDGWYVTTGELQAGATGLAVPIGPDVADASVGVVTLGGLDEQTVGPAVVRAARAIRAVLAGTSRSGSLRFPPQTASRSPTDAA
jgi:DNA-binding IclR family transcriptional regulator